MRDIVKLIHAASDANFDTNVYTKVYAGDNATPTINGIEVPMVGGTTIEILVSSISATPNVFVLGRKRTIPPSVING